MWISKREWEEKQRSINKLKKEVEELNRDRESMIRIIIGGNEYCADTIARLRKRIAWLEAHFPPPIADSLTFAYTLDGVTFKSKHMSLLLPAGKQVILTIKGSGKDASGNTVEAPVTGTSVSVSGPGLGVSQNTDGTFTLKYLADDAGTISATAQNSLGTAVSGTDAYTTGGTPPPPVIADSLTFNYGVPTDIV